MRRKNKQEYYVLHYDTKTNEYLNKIELKTLNIAFKEFINAKHINENDRIELIYAPIDNTRDNKIIITK